MSKQINDEIDMILNQNTSSILDKLEQLRQELNNGMTQHLNDTFVGGISYAQELEEDTMSAVDVLKALSFDDTLTIADRLVMTIVYGSNKVTTDLLLDLTLMSGVGLRRILKKLTVRGYIRKIKNGLYEKANTKIY